MKKYMNKSITEIHEALIKGEVTSKELIQESLQKSHEIQDHFFGFFQIY